MNPCSNDNPCAPSAECTVNNHRAICKCPPGFTGDAYSRCVPSKKLDILDYKGRFETDDVFIWILVQKGECQIDMDCPDNRACIGNQCLDPCVIDDPCGTNAQCETTSHRPVCRCPSGWAGDPHTECYQCRFLDSTQYQCNIDSWLQIFIAHFRWMSGKQRLPSWQSM